MTAAADTLLAAPPIPPGAGGPSRWAVARRAFLRRRGRLVGLAILAGFLVMGAIGPYLYPKNLPVDPNRIYAPPSLAYPLGTDFEGTSVLALIVTGARYVLLSAVVAGAVTMAIGVTIGLLAGYRAGLLDSVLSRFTDFVLTVPGIPLLIVLATVWHFSSPFLVGLLLGATGWGGLARAIRSQILSLRERSFIEASRGLGLSPWHIGVREMLPNVSSYVAMHLLLAVVGAIYAETGLFFLGILPATVNNWGVMLNLAVFSAGAIGSPAALPYLLSPLVAIMLLTLGIVLVLDAVDEVFNPRLRAS